MALDLKALQGFEWDSGNSEKSKVKQDVTVSECEEVFFNLPLFLTDDVKHSQQEKRYYVLGQTSKWRQLFVAFTVRGDKIRVISARKMSRKERKIYEQEEKPSPVEKPKEENS